jgi:hypothetical protein
MRSFAGVVACCWLLGSGSGCASSLSIRSTPPGAKILIDGQDTGFATPDTLRPRIIPSGRHEISVAIDGQRSEPKVIENHLSAKLIIWSLIWPGSLLVNMFKGFSHTEPGELTFDLQHSSAAASASPAPASTVQSFTGERRRVGKSGLKCAAMPLKAKDVAPQMTFIMDDLLLAEIQQSGFEAIGPEDINALLGFEKTKSAVGCDDASCVAEIGNALGVDYLAAGSVAALEGSVVLTLKLIDVKRTKVLARVNKMAEDGPKGLPRLIGEAVSDLVAQSGL